MTAGFVVFLTGYSGAGKSSVARALCARLRGGAATLLDGEALRRERSADLGFSREDRDRNVLRLGQAAVELARRGDVAVCAAIAPYDAARKQVRRLVEAVGGFHLVHLSTPLSECERRDPKGHYARARAGLLKSFTGLDDPYEAPEDAEQVLDTSGRTAEDCAAEIAARLESGGRR